MRAAISKVSRPDKTLATRRAYLCVLLVGCIYAMHRIGVGIPVCCFSVQGKLAFILGTKDGTSVPKLTSLV